MTELILLLLAIAALNINVCMVALIVKMLFCKEKSADVVPEETVNDKRRKELEFQEWMQQGLDNIMSYDGSPKRKEGDAQ